MTLTSQEKETIICFNEAEPIAEVFTYNGRMLRELSKLAEDRPNEAQHISDNGTGGSTYRVPKKWVKIRASRILTEEQRTAAVERAHRMNFKRKNNDAD